MPEGGEHLIRNRRKNDRTMPEGDIINKRQRITKGQSKMDNPGKLPTQDDKKTTQNVLDTTVRKQT